MYKPDYAKHTKSEIVGFTKVMSVFFGLVAAYLSYASDWSLPFSSQVCLGVALFWLVFGGAAPSLLKPLYHGWMHLAYYLNFVMTRILLGIVFYLVMMPISLVMRIVGKDPLNRRGKAESYWKLRTEKAPRDHFEQLYTLQSGVLEPGKAVADSYKANTNASKA